MASRIWILGASDPEMAAIESLLTECGETVKFAVARGERVRPGNAYAAKPQYPYDRFCGDLYLVECAFATECRARTVHTTDHHRPGDAGFGATPSDFLRASSVGQVISVLAKLDVLPASWFRGGMHSRPGSCAGFAGDLECSAECWYVVDHHRASRVIPLELVRALEARREVLGQ